MWWLINIFFLCQIWALYLQQVLNNTPMNKDPQPNFKLCPATLACKNLTTVHFWTYISKKKNFKMCFRWRRIWCFWCAIVLKGTVTRFCACAASWSLVWRTFFQDWLLVKNSLPSTLRRPRKLLYQYSRDILSILDVLNAIFFIFVQALSKQFEVIEEKCTKAYYLLTVFPDLQTD